MICWNSVFELIITNVVVFFFVAVELYNFYVGIVDFRFGFEQQFQNVLAVLTPRNAKAHEYNSGRDGGIVIFTRYFFDFVFFFQRSSGSHVQAEFFSTKFNQTANCFDLCGFCDDVSFVENNKSRISLNREIIANFASESAIEVSNYAVVS
jgi:hypothetical protein